MKLSQSLLYFQKFLFALKFLHFPSFLLSLSLLIILLLFTACGRTNEVGGRLPIVITQWDDTEVDVLRWFTYGGYLETQLAPIHQTADIARIGDDFPVPRAMVAKMLALANADPHAIASWAVYPTIDFVDVNPQSWYFEYVNSAYILNQMSGSGEVFRPHDMLTLHEAGLLMAALNPDGPGLLITDDNRNLPISYALWVDLYMQFLGDADAIKTVQIIPLSYDAAKEQVITNVGVFSGIGINMERYLDREIKILHRGSEIVALLGQVSATPTLSNVFVLRGDDVGVTVSIGGAVRDFLYMDGTMPLPEGTVIADIQISGGEIIAATPSDGVIRGTIEQVGQRRIILREWGLLPLRPQFAVYSTLNGVTTGSPADLIVGANTADFHLINGAIGAAVITEMALPAYIRVLIGTSNFEGLVHDSVAVTSTGPFTVITSSGSFTATTSADSLTATTSGDSQSTAETDNTVKSLSQGEVFTVTGADLADDSRLYIMPINPEHRLEIVGLARNQSAPLYRGTLEIIRAEGGFIIVNELPLEEYLYAVVPSEMPSYFGVEAAKVQAVTARTFAVHQFYQNRFRAFGAHVDDSVISQVYNNIPENDISREAVRATAGQVLTAYGEIVMANYFSTSSGITANFGEVWASGSDFPTYTPKHLTSRLQFDPGDISDRALRRAVRDLSIEENADIFFRTTDIPAFERDLPWFRWQVRMTAEALSQSINGSLSTRRQANPSMIHALDANGASTGIPISSIGRLTGMEITRRGQGGNVMEVILSGTEGIVRVQTEFNIRTLLAPHTATVTRINGSTVNNLALMPSGFFTIEKETDAGGNLVAITFYGGGHGHGVGMSQNGANLLLNAGYSYRDVLLHYYPGVDIGTGVGIGLRDVE